MCPVLRHLLDPVPLADDGLGRSKLGVVFQAHEDEARVLAQGSWLLARHKAIVSKTARFAAAPLAKRVDPILGSWGGIFLRQSDGSLLAMRKAPYEAEKVLQDLVGDHPEVVRGDDSEGGGGGWLLVRREAIGPRSQARGRQAERRLKMPTDSGMSFPVTSGVVSSDTDSRSLATFLSLYR